MTPLPKSRPMFRFDTGSGKKSCKPKGHKMSPNSSPWGVFGANDEWKPLAAPDVSRALADANKVVAEIAIAASVPSSPSPKSSAFNKRHVQSITHASSPSKRTRTVDSPVSSSPCKENLDPLFPTMYPSMRAYTRSKAPREAPTALPLSTVR
ncbi:hypothetical protein PSEUBRA_000407 [Kalmanozyma brasiliensis GHG001]|uniref:uncharacterized protein n=1 Tax=Kalmanozyma brasiliensis (strain GHG001) TaxID=1365824 RepID=UPI002867B68C|nr:uncharacterized protein PSEUBRA_000407 [Kalmanozyma brasiliensis GHG001]KAF6766807.1 hypothetical protein PSEUBRA_000407 [Kalmanozyma brasiliensis GHG001]